MLSYFTSISFLFIENIPMSKDCAWDIESLTKKGHQKFKTQQIINYSKYKNKISDMYIKVAHKFCVRYFK